MKIKIENLSQYGIIQDLPPQELPPNAFTDGKNVRFTNGKVQKFTGESQVFGAASITPYYATPFSDGTTYYWIICGANKVYITDGTTWTNITRQTAGNDVNYSATLDINWNGGILGGTIPILNNGADDPQQWSPATAGTKLASLKYASGTTWSSVGYTARIMRTFKNYIVAMDVTKSSTRYSNLVKWSSAADPGALPDTWDESDATFDAGEAVLTESGGDLIEGAALRDNFIIYAEDATHAMSYIGGNYVFRFSRLFSDGIISRRCVKSLKGLHLVLAANDLILHDGSTAKSVINKRLQSYLFNNIDPTNYTRCFITPNYRLNEMWICFPSIGSTLPDTALVWNYVDDNFGFRDIPDTPHIAYGVVDPGVSRIIDSLTGTIDSNTWIIDSRTYNPTIFYPLLLNGNCYQGDYSEQFSGTSFTSYIERTDLDFGDPQIVKHIKRLIPKMTGSGQVTIKLGSQPYPGGSVTWKSYLFTPGTDWKIDTRVSGKFLAWRIESSDNITWDISDIEFEFDQAGGR